MNGATESPHAAGYVDVAAVARRLNFCRATVIRLIERGTLRAMRLPGTSKNRRWRIESSSVDEMIRQGGQHES